MIVNLEIKKSKWMLIVLLFKYNQGKPYILNLKLSPNYPAQSMSKKSEI